MLVLFLWGISNVKYICLILSNNPTWNLPPALWVGVWWQTSDLLVNRSRWCILCWSCSSGFSQFVCGLRVLPSRRLEERRFKRDPRQLECANDSMRCSRWNESQLFAEEKKGEWKPNRLSYCSYLWKTQAVEHFAKPLIGKLFHRGILATETEHKVAFGFLYMSACIKL